MTGGQKAYAPLGNLVKHVHRRFVWIDVNFAAVDNFNFHELLLRREFVTNRKNIVEVARDSRPGGCYAKTFMTGSFWWVGQCRLTRSWGTALAAFLDRPQVED
jgi:hypothetical protein